MQNSWKINKTEEKRAKKTGMTQGNKAVLIISFDAFRTSYLSATHIPEFLFQAVSLLILNVGFSSVVMSEAERNEAVMSVELAT